MTMVKKVGVISLGCDKNRVDTEKMLAVLSQEYELTPDIEKANIIIINTCAFLESARKEAIDEILSASLYKQYGALEKLIVTGCLPQKFIDELKDELIEVDAFLGVSDYDRLLQVIKDCYKGERVNAVGVPKGEVGTDRVLTTSNYAYIKIADGCFNRCSYCLIPYIRGNYRSVPRNDIFEEVNKLGRVEELILVAQDTTRYGADIKDGYDVVDLIRDISAMENVGSIRLLYCYPEGITDKLINEFKTNDKLIKYIDMPLQHADDTVLKAMRRRGSKQKYLDIITRLKSEVDGIAIRSTFIAGFPGETDENFENLLDFISKAQLFNAGFFRYSRERGTPAYDFSGQVPERVKYNRVRKLYSLQKSISRANLKGYKGKTLSVVAEGFDDEQLLYYGRAYFNAPDIDGRVYFTAPLPIEYGTRYDIKVVKTTDYDLFGQVEI